MKILLLSMPDSFEHTPSVAMRMPNGALGSLAGNVDGHHEVGIADLVLAQSTTRQTIERLMRKCDPDVVGLSVMTFQRRTARRIIALVRALKPQVKVVVGGYDPSLAPDAWTNPRLGADVIVQGEGDVTFRELIRAIETGRPLSQVSGLWYRDGDAFHRTPLRHIAGLNDGEIRPPNRGARILSGYTMLGRPVDVVETSRGCTFDCSFCSIIDSRSTV
jgi:anaerobic magnesium-protoporphyrin IX monomethyl ester cyclase